MSEYRLKEIHNHVNNPGNLLDVGCGKGRFIAKANDRGWKAQGVEPSNSQVRFAREQYSIDVFAGDLYQAKFPDNSFDVVTAWHVLEHVQNLRAFIAEIQRVIRVGGLFVCEIPNFASWQAKFGRDIWFHLDVPRHLVHYTPDALERLISQYDFLIVKLNTFSLENGPVGMLQTLLNLIGLPPNLLWQWIKRASSYNQKRAFPRSLLRKAVRLRDE